MVSRFIGLELIFLRKKCSFWVVERFTRAREPLNNLLCVGKIMNENSVNKTLKRVLQAGSIWDLIGAIIFIVIHGILQKQLTPEIYPFYSIVIGSFLLVLSYLQFITSKDIRRYCSNIGVVICIRVIFATTVILYSFISEFLPAQFFAIASIDIIFVVLLVTFARSRGAFSLKELFIHQ